MSIGWRAIIGFGAAGLAAVALSFVWFASSLTAYSPILTEAADGIVVLTGAELRIAEGFRLLQKGMGRRMLVSGVHHTTSKESLRHLIRIEDTRLLECCVDLGHEAVDTVSNAREARKWADRHAYQSLIVVTSVQHLPRSLAEIGAAAPGVRLIPYPVIHRNLHLEAWWAYPRTMAALGIEFAKHVGASIRRTARRLVSSVWHSAETESRPAVALSTPSQP